MATIKKIADVQGNQVFPQTHTKAVIDNDGNSVETILGKHLEVIQQAQLEVGAVPSDLTPTRNSSNWVTSGGVFPLVNIEGTNVFDIEDETVSLSGTSVESYMSIEKITDGFTVECLQTGSSRYALCTISNVKVGETYIISFDYVLTNESSATYPYLITIRTSTASSSTSLVGFTLQNRGMSGSVQGTFTPTTSTTVFRVANNDIGVVNGTVTITNISITSVTSLKNVVLEETSDITAIGEKQMLDTYNSLAIEDCEIGNTNTSYITIEKIDGNLVFTGKNKTSGRYAYVKLPKYLIEGRQYTLTAEYTTDSTVNIPFPFSTLNNLGNSHGGVTFTKSTTTSTEISTVFTYNGTDDCLRVNASSMSVNSVLRITNLKLQAAGSIFEKYDKKFQVLDDEGDFSEANTVKTYTGTKIPSLRTHKFGWTYIMDSARTGSIQGCAAHNGYMFEFVDNNEYVYVYNLATATYHSKVYPTNISTGHANTACFSNIYYDPSDDFPLLYVSGGYSSSDHVAQVYRITLSNDVFTIIQIQNLITPVPTAENQLYSANILVDFRQGYGTQKGFLWLSCNRGEKGMLWAKFAIPDIFDSENQVIAEATLTDEDMLDSFWTDTVVSRQSGIVVDGICYMVSGVPSWGDTVYFTAVDLWGKHLINNRVNLTEMGWNKEPEGLGLYHGYLYCNTQKTGIYKFYF